MLKIKRHKQFIKDLAKCKINDQQYTKLILYLSILINKQPLPKEAKDHNLKGDFIGFRECHISGDLLLIYKIENNTLNLVRIGTHSQLFK